MTTFMAAALRAAAPVTEISDVRLFAIHPAIVLETPVLAAAGNGEENRQAGRCKPANIPPCRFSGKTLLSALLG